VAAGKITLNTLKNISPIYSNVTAVCGEQCVLPEGKSAHRATPAPLLALSVLTVPGQGTLQGHE